jgi:hypothetical protein
VKQVFGCRLGHGPGLGRERSAGQRSMSGLSSGLGRPPATGTVLQNYLLIEHKVDASYLQP